ncbi:hypothetical protein FB45DRAFT_1039341 [Roridomyces roridus]|uniref:Uncharacterized protein n=1 Tax=Roridomyces roridus TaxID=1738132 RepID=A0AAD7B3E5_9AGAR|nr:hypothetical protein FB45DRAFT_1039341 [Roridomyces roridus]
MTGGLARCMAHGVYVFTDPLRELITIVLPYFGARTMVYECADIDIIVLGRFSFTVNSSKDVSLETRAASTFKRYSITLDILKSLCSRHSTQTTASAMLSANQKDNSSQYADSLKENDSGSISDTSTSFTLTAYESQMDFTWLPDSQDYLLLSLTHYGFVNFFVCWKNSSGADRAVDGSPIHFSVVKQQMETRFQCLSLPGYRASPGSSMDILEWRLRHYPDAFFYSRIPRRALQNGFGSHIAPHKYSLARLPTIDSTENGQAKTPSSAMSRFGGPGWRLARGTKNCEQQHQTFVHTSVVKRCVYLGSINAIPLRHPLPHKFLFIPNNDYQVSTAVKMGSRSVFEVRHDEEGIKADVEGGEGQSGLGQFLSMQLWLCKACLAKRRPVLILWDHQVGEHSRDEFAPRMLMAIPGSSRDRLKPHHLRGSSSSVPVTNATMAAREPSTNLQTVLDIESSPTFGVQRRNPRRPETAPSGTPGAPSSSSSVLSALLSSVCLGHGWDQGCFNNPGKIMQSLSSRKYPNSLATAHEDLPHAAACDFSAAIPADPCQSTKKSMT